MTNAEASIISKIVSLPYEIWQFNQGPNQNFSWNDTDYVYKLFVSGDQVYEFLIFNLNRVTKNNDKPIKIEPNDTLREYVIRLMDELIKKSNIAREIELADINRSLGEIINRIAKRENLSL